MTTTTVAPPGSAEATGLLARARELVPVLRERALGVERAGHVPAETVADLKAAGLLRAATPVEFGGYAGVDFDLALDIAAELSRGCASTAWCYSVWMIHNWMVGNMNPRAQAEYFAGGPDTISSTASSPKHSAVSFTDTGYRLSGHWSFASGSRHSQWFFVGPPELLLAMMVPVSDVQVLDTWRSSGLRGTGSNDITLDDADVPAHRIWTPLDDSAPGGPIGWARHGRPSYRLAMWMFTYTIVAPIAGAARGAVEAFTQRYLGTGRPAPGRPPSSRHGESEPLQIALAESAAEVDAADLLWRTDLRSALDQAAAGRPFSLAERATVRRNQAYATKLCVRAVTRLFEATGAHALSEEDPLQRAFRDVHAACHHVTVPWEATMANFGSVVLGQPFAMEFQRDGIDPALIAMPPAPPA